MVGLDARVEVARTRDEVVNAERDEEGVNPCTADAELAMARREPMAVLNFIISMMSWFLH